MRGYPSSGQDKNHFCCSQEKVWPRHGSNSVPPHFCPEGIPSSWANVVRKLSGIASCHGVSVGVLSFLTSFVINIFAVTAGFVITLLFPVHCSYLSWRSWPIVPPAGVGRSGSGSWFSGRTGELYSHTTTEGENAKWMNATEPLSLKLWRCNVAWWQEWCSMTILNDAE